jgi:hypothetical protein
VKESEIASDRTLEPVWDTGKSNYTSVDLDEFQMHTVLIPQVRPAHKYSISPWEMIDLPGGR